MNESECVVFYGIEIIRTTPTGEVDLEATKNRLWEMVTPDEPITCEALFDLRDAPGELTPSDLDELALEMGRIDHLFVGKVALLYDGPARDEAVATSPDGRYQVAHFVDFDEAMHWLTA